MSVKTILRYLANHAHLNSLIFLSLNPQGQRPLDLLDRFVVVNDIEKFEKELIEKGFSLDESLNTNGRILVKDDLSLGLIGGLGDCKYIVMRSDDSAFKLLMSTYLLEDQENLTIKAQSDGVRFLWKDESGNEYAVYISHNGRYEVYYLLCNEVGESRP